MSNYAENNLEETLKAIERNNKSHSNIYACVCMCMEHVCMEHNCIHIPEICSK